jgi:hypothetical protein
MNNREKRNLYAITVIHQLKLTSILINVFDSSNFSHISDSQTVCRQENLLCRENSQNFPFPKSQNFSFSTL